MVDANDQKGSINAHAGCSPARAFFVGQNGMSSAAAVARNAAAALVDWVRHGAILVEVLGLDVVLAGAAVLGGAAAGSHRLTFARASPARVV
jgi:hypothetical protein